MRFEYIMPFIYRALTLSQDPRVKSMSRQQIIISKQCFRNVRSQQECVESARDVYLTFCAQQLEAYDNSRRLRVK